MSSYNEEFVLFLKAIFDVAACNSKEMVSAISHHFKPMFLEQEYSQKFHKPYRYYQTFPKLL